ncbi:glycoside hydrolase family 35 protein [Crepidotus variabilis]|uniref:beta-galactosidase n=1 Tax=Crepidotus variabilis TaxID=179855 RepID=A0A9P6JKT3_9AGAR|nr:glycoside hydrolase family 35 protein [Crepidotus variabilis]
MVQNFKILLLAAVLTISVQSLSRTEDVIFDNYSLILKGQRLFLHSGEFHTFRLPIPSLWPDILEKVKAAGFNGISVYTHMGLLNPTPGVIDMDGYRSLQPLFDAAKATGVWVILRPGTYINAETTAGGIAHWATSEVSGRFRTNASDWQAAWEDYINAIIKATIPNQINNGGPVIAIQIDNEYNQDPEEQAEYFKQLEEVYRNSDIVVPLTYNNAGRGASFINGTGAVDLYGMDSYPQGADCANPRTWTPINNNDSDHKYHMKVNPSQPWFYPEFQAGVFDSWGPNSPGYDGCRVLTGTDFSRVWNRQVWANNAKLINYYMFYGGTSWGALPYPGVYTSYDYAASISESRELTSKYDEMKRQAMFIRSSREFVKTNWIGDSSTGLNVSSSLNAWVTLLQNPDTGTSFYIVRNKDSTSIGTVDFKLTVQTSDLGVVTVPTVASAITLGGRQSKLVITDYTFGASSKVAYSTAQVFFAGVIDGRDILFLYGDPAHEHEFALHLTGKPNKLQNEKPALFQISEQSTNAPHVTTVNLLEGVEQLVTVYDSDTMLVLYADEATTATFWAPTIAVKADDQFKNYWGIGTNDTILIGGPYLVREAIITGTTLALRGDLKEDARITIIAPKALRSISWNGQIITADLTASSHISPSSGFIGQVSTKTSLGGVHLPKLTGWKYKDSLPELQHTFDDSQWTTANHTSTKIPWKPNFGDGRILYGCDYGFCENTVLWRGHFTANGNEKSVRLSINGGTAFAGSVWLNDVFLGTSFGNSSDGQHMQGQTDEVFNLPINAVNVGQDNVVTIVQDNMGLDETGASTDYSKSPRGIRGNSLDNNNFTRWKVQGKVGGYRAFPDKTRGVMNEGGLSGERKGWHLPSFQTSEWEARDLSQGLPNSAAGVGFFVTTFKLDIPRGLDAMISFTFIEPFGQPYRAFLFINGWMMGKRIGNLGPQAKFPVHEGILDYRGENTVAVALWAMIPNVTIAPDLQLTLDSVYDTGIREVLINNPAWSSEGRE